MAWSPAFLAALQGRRVALRWAVETFGTATGAGVGRFPVVYTSHPVGAGAAILDGGSVKVGSHSLSLSSWAYRRQSWSFRLVAPRNLGSVAETLTPGTLIRLRCDARGAAYGANWEVIQSGVVADVRWQAGDLRVTVYDLLTGLRQRFASLGTALSLFPNAGRETTLTANYTPGDGTLTVADSTGFDELSGALPDLVEVEPTSGDPFLLTYTGSTATTLNGCSSTGQLGTTAAAAASGQTVRQISYQNARPDQIIARILTSTGTLNANGVSDVLPARWAYGLDWQTTIDTGELTSVGNSIFGAVSGGWDIDLQVTQEQTDGLAWLQGVLSAAAVWLVNRQGLISMRTPQDPNAPIVGPVAAIFDRDIQGGAAPECQWYHPDRRVAYNRSTVKSATGSSSNVGPALGIATYPAENSRNYDLGSLVYANETAIREDLAARVAPWDTTIPERVVLPLQSCAWARLVPGDLVTLRIPEMARRYAVRGRYQSTTGGYVARIGMVDEVAVDWQRGTTTVGVAVAPLNRPDNRQ